MRGSNMGSLRYLSIIALLVLTPSYTRAAQCLFDCPLPSSETMSLAASGLSYSGGSSPLALSGNGLRTDANARLVTDLQTGPATGTDQFGVQFSGGTLTVRDLNTFDVLLQTPVQRTELFFGFGPRVVSDLPGGGEWQWRLALNSVGAGCPNLPIYSGGPISGGSGGICTGGETTWNLTPEPTTAVMIASGLIGLFTWRRMRRARWGPLPSESSCS